MKAVTSVVIELAATIDWLTKKERIADWRKELKIRKPSKADDSRIEQALLLLSKLGLAPEGSRVEGLAGTPLS